MNTIKDSYIIVHSWMTQQLKLKGNSLIIFALIDGYTQSEGLCKCGIDYICKWLNSSKSGVLKCLNELEESGLIKRMESGENDKRKTGYISKIGPESVPNYDKLGLKNRPIIEEIGPESVPNCSEIGLKNRPIIEEIGPESVPNCSEIGVKNRPISEIGLKSVPNSARKVHFLNEIGPENGPCNNIYINSDRQTDSLSDSQSESKSNIDFYLDCINTHINNSDVDFRNEYGFRLKDICKRISLSETITINKIPVPAAEVLQAINDLFRNPESIETAFGAVDNSTPKNKFGYTVSTLYNTSKKF